jgi:NAD(P)-dependent dehydrogenase (short-subunit alcohol dehydrogenase family)
MTLLTNRVVWITGASGVIGSAISTRACVEGARVVLSGRTSDTLEKLADTLVCSGYSITVIQTDVTDPVSIQQSLQQILSKFQRIDCLVNSTSISAFGSFLDLSDDTWLDVMDTKLLGYMRTMRAVLPQMISQGAGSIVNISGRSGHQPTTTHLPGACANAAINVLDKGLADAMLDHGIRINTIAPGPIVSERFDRLQSLTAQIAGQKIQQFKQAGTPEDVANAAVWLLSDQARHITGTVMSVDGGATATV